MIQNVFQQPHITTFKANINSPKLKFKSEDFYIRIRGYGKNEQWAEFVKKLADNAVRMIIEKGDFDTVLRKITNGMRIANLNTLDLLKKEHTGILRTKRNKWKSSNSEEWKFSYTKYGKKGNLKYKDYESKLDTTIKHPLRNPYKDIKLTRPAIEKEGKCINHPENIFINNALAHVEKIYNYIMKKYMSKEININDLEIINNAIAQMRWILAHSTPWERGSDAISNVFMKALYKSLGIKTFKPAKGISFDLEAYCTNLKDYRNNFTSYFEKPPIIID